MSYVALAVGVVGAGTAAYGAYASSQQQKKAQGGLSYTAPDYGDTQSYLNSNYYLPQYQEYTPTPYTTGYDQFLGAGNKYGARINRFLEKNNDWSNRQYRNDLFRSSPTLQGNIAQQGANTQQFLRGQIPIDVQAQVKNNAAETSLFGGYGGSQMARNLVARDLGLTSLDLINRGNAGLQQQLGYAQSLNPYQSNTLDYLMSPAQLQAQAIGQNQFGLNVANQNQTNYANIANQRAQMIANLMKQQEDANAGAINTNNVLDYQRAAALDPWVSALSTGGGALASSVGGGMGGGASGGTNYSGLINLLSGMMGQGQGQGAGPYGSTYTGSYQGLPIYQPARA